MDFYHTKVNYIHMNPVRAGIVEKEEEYTNSSAVLWNQEKQVGVEQIWLNRVPDPTIVLRNCKFRRAGISFKNNIRDGVSTIID
jgi:hypothetical protein